jgi:predicted acyltransferase
MYTEFSAFRVLGVLQRIAIVYFICSMMALYMPHKQQVYTSVFILLSYWFIVLFIPAPGLEAGSLVRGENIINWFDKFLPGMLWRGTWDPEGLLSTYPSIVSGTLGMFAGMIIVRSKDLSSTVMNMFVYGFIIFTIGYIWGFFFPFIKQIWTSTYVLATGGIGAMVLAAMLWYTDVKGSRKGTYMSMVFGTNAITAYTIHVAFEKLLDLSGYSIHDVYVSYAESFGINSIASSTAWVLFFVTVCFIPIWVMYKRKIFVKI